MPAGFQKCLWVCVCVCLFAGKESPHCFGREKWMPCITHCPHAGFRLDVTASVGSLPCALLYFIQACITVIKQLYSSMHHLNGAKAADIYDRMRGDKTNIFISLYKNKAAIKAFQNTGEKHCNFNCGILKCRLTLRQLWENNRLVIILHADSHFLSIKMHQINGELHDHICADKRGSYHGDPGIGVVATGRLSLGKISPSILTLKGSSWTQTHTYTERKDTP